MIEFGPGLNPPELAPKEYRKTAIVKMWRLDEPFVCHSREGKSLEGKPGDYLAEDGHGGYYPISAEFHAKNYVEWPV